MAIFLFFSSGYLLGLESTASRMFANAKSLLLQNKIKTAEEAIAKAEQSIKEFNALASDEEKNEELNAYIKAQNEEYQAEINALNNEISKLKEIQPELQARVDRLQAAIDAAEAVLAE